MSAGGREHMGAGSMAAINERVGRGRPMSAPKFGEIRGVSRRP